MILRRIILEDFGLYAGRQELDLTPRGRQGDHPIVLVGGRNGAGKTTLLEAIRVALYGRRALGARVSQAEYDQYLTRRVHSGGDADSAAVTLEFDYAEGGEVHTYSVRRSWTVGAKSVVETLLLEKNGSEVSAVPKEEWHHFLLDLIPPGVSQLFFFDGEKIQDIADGENADGQLADAVRGLLGVELVERLRNDLGLYYARQQRLEDPAALERLSAVRVEIDAAEAQTDALRDEIADLATTRESVARAAEQVRRTFVAEGGDAARNRGRLEAERDSYRRQLTRGVQDLREIANGLLPFLFAPTVVAKVRGALEQVAGEASGRPVAPLKGALASWRKTGEPDRTASWGPDHWSDLEGFLTHWSKSGESARAPHALRELGDGKAALSRLLEVETLTRSRAKALGQDLQQWTRELRRTESELTRADNADTGVMLQELINAEQKVAAVEAALKAREEELRLMRGRLVTLRRELERLYEDQTAADTAVARAKLSARVSKVLATYEKRLLDLKLEQLSEEFAACFNRLARKGDLVSGVRFDPQFFTPTLIGPTGRDVAKDALSAGEKQIFAIAMLWALARTSGRPLPMVIDTPLARLDSEHRANLVDRYFPNASHQVVLLSTDTEIDDRLFSSLGDSVSHAYRLDYQAQEGRTLVSEGYFTPDQTGEVEGALQQA